MGVVVSHFVPKAFYTFREKKIKKREGERGNRCKGTELILIITIIEIKKVDLFLSYFFCLNLHFNYCKVRDSIEILKFF